MLFSTGTTAGEIDEVPVALQHNGTTETVPREYSMVAIDLTTSNKTHSSTKKLQFNRKDCEIQYTKL